MNRPLRREDCAGAPRPCPWVGCQYHLLLELAPRTLGLRSRDLDIVSDEAILAVLGGMEETCVLDMVERSGRHTLEDIGRVFGVTRERIRQIQDKGLERAKFIAEARGIKVDISELLDMVGK